MPGILAGLLPALLQGVIGGIGGQTAPAAPQPVDAGVQSAMGAGSPAPMQENPTGGTSFKALLNKGIADGVQSLVGAKIGKWKAGQAGLANREYLNSAFPELNPWELAGASATGAGVGMSQQDVQSEMQEKELKTRKEMQDEQIAFGKDQLATQERMNAVSAAAGVQSAAIGAGTMNAQVAMLNALRAADIDLRELQQINTDAETATIMDSNKRSWASNLVNALMSGHSVNMGVRDPAFKTEAVKANLAQSLFGGVGGILKSATGAKLLNWFRK